MDCPLLKRVVFEGMGRGNARCSTLILGSKATQDPEATQVEKLLGSALI